MALSERGFPASVPVRQLARFLAVGVSNTLLSLAVYGALLAAGTPTPAAAALAFAAGAVNGYVLNRTLTFGARDSLAARVRYVAVQAAGMAANGALVALLVEAGTGRLGAYAVAVPPVTLATFVANRGWTFVTSPARSPGTDCS